MFLFRHVLSLLLLLALAGCMGGLAREDAATFPDPPAGAVSFWGHACTYLDVDGVGIVTDPVFETRLFLRSRRIAAPPRSAYQATRAVLISHAHPDHLSPKTLAAFPADAVVVCPIQSAKYLDDSVQPVHPMAPGDTLVIDGVRIIAVAAHHMGSRWGVFAAADGRALGYVVEGAATTVYYSGDTNFFSGFADVGWTYEPDLVLLNVNGHLRETDAVRAAWATRSSVVVPIHWGAFRYWVVDENDRPRDEAMLRRLVGDYLHVMEIGESLPLPRRGGPRYNAAGRTSDVPEHRATEP